MDEKKFCFISCVDDERAYEECVFYISHLRIPTGYTAEIMPVREAAGMAAGYNKGMSASDAKYKIYVHQDCFIINPNFLYDILTVFGKSGDIGMIGVMGVPKVSPDGVAENTMQVGNIYTSEQGHEGYSLYGFSAEENVYDCDYVNGMIIVTNRDIHWREDLFDGWDFYDASQGMEFKKQGLRVVVPEQRLPWCSHEENLLNRWAYDKYRRIFVNEYLV